MGVYTFNVGNLPTVPPEGPLTGAGTGKIIAPAGKWTSARIRVFGSFVPNTFAGSGSIECAFTGHTYDITTYTASGGTFDSGFYNAPNALASVNSNLGKQIQSTYFQSGSYSTSQITATILELTGTLYQTSSGIAMPIKMGNLFFFNPTYPEPSLGSPNTPPTYPDPQFNYPQYEDTFSPYPSGGLRSRAREGNDQQGNRGKMSCLVPKQTVYLSIPGNLVLPQNFPVMVILNYPNTTAQWLKWNPGLYNAGGSPSQIEARIYQGNPGSAQPGIWVPSVGLTNLRPVWVGQGSYSDLIPWGGQPMQLVIELAGISNIPAGSFFDAVLEGFDSD